MSESIEHDTHFNSWEDEKAYKIKRLGTIQAELNEIYPILKQVGIMPQTTDAKLNAICDMLMKAGVINEKQLLDMEVDFAEGVLREFLDMVESIRNEANKQRLIGGTPAARPQQGLIVPGR